MIKIKKYELYDNNFTIKCELDCENVNWYFLDEYGGRTEILNANKSFEDESTQKKYEAFVKSINKVAESELHLIDYSAPLEIGETVKMDGFSIKRQY